MANNRTVRALAALSRGDEVGPWTFEARLTRPHDVVLDVEFCGICHTDLHMINQWGTDFPMVPGHEAVGRVSAVGESVTEVAVGDRVGVGTIVASCGECEHCRDHLEPYCLRGATPAYGAPDPVDGTPTRGGYAESMVVDEGFVFGIPDALDSAGAAPLLCAGITTYSPLRHWEVGPGSAVAVIGVGGLGHLGIKFARALGAEVVAFTTSPDKLTDCLALGAHEAVLSRDAEKVTAQRNRFDFVLDTVSTTYPMTPIVETLRLNGTLCTLGLPDRLDVSSWALATGRRSIASSGAGGTVETREMLAFAAQHGITADVETVTPDEVPEALRRLARNDVKYRFVMDRTT